jgi:hypothetical protein
MKLSSLAASLAVLASALFSVSTPGYADGYVTPDVSVSVTVTPSGSGFDWDYTVQITNPSAAPINIFEIPETQSGAFASVNYTVPVGWTATEETSAPFADPLIKPSTAPAAWLVVSTLNLADAINYSPENIPLSFDFYSTLGGSVPAQFSTAYREFAGDTPDYFFTVTLDPPTPSSVPEPATWIMMGLGALGLVALRRRKGALSPARA